MGPTDVAHAFVQGGKLYAVDGRGQQWEFDGSKSKGKDKPAAPQGAEYAFVLNERLIVLDGSGVWWTYSLTNSTWAEGNGIDDVMAMPSAADEEAAKDDPWIKGPNVEASTLHADEERRAQALIDAKEDKEKDKKGGKKKEAA